MRAMGRGSLCKAIAENVQAVLTAADCLVSSPPYANGLGKEETYTDHAKREKDSQRGIMREKGIVDPFYGQHPAQLGNLPPGSVADAILSSPPYANGCAHTGGTDPQPQHIQGGSLPYVTYGTERGQLAALPMGEVAAVVSSPPWEDQLVNHHTPEKYEALKAKVIRDGKGHGGKFSVGQPYGDESAGQLGATAGDTFWEAARTILAQTYAVLRPGGHAIWVVKDYCRKGQIVPFSQQWKTLAEHVGFVTLHEHHAMLVEEHGIQRGLFGEDTQHQTQRKSFFRRLHERKRPDLAINYETILCMVKPHAGMPPDDAWQ